MSSTTLPRLMKADEVSEQTGLSAHRLYELCRQGEIPHARIGRSVRFDPVAAREWIENGGTAAPENAEG